MVDWPLLVGGVVAIGPALALLLFSYAPYDGHFKDNILFLFFMGGLFGGMALAVLEVGLRAPRLQPLYTFGMVVVGFPILENMLKLVALNRKKYQGERTTVFYGGSLGLGLGVMLTLVKSQDPSEIPLRQGLGLAPFLLAAGVAVLLAQFATGLVLGDAVRRRALRAGVALALAAAIPAQFFVFLFIQALHAGLVPSDFLYLAAALVYAGALAWWAHTRLLPQALPPDAQRKRRRALLRQRRAEAGKEP